MIESELSAEKIKEYNNTIASADAQMKVQNLSSARFYYRNALEIKKSDPYPLEQLKVIDKMITDQLSRSDQRVFAENVKKADDSFNRKEYPTARFYYEKAKEISETDHITSRLKEIEAIIKAIDLQK
jgi:uncharacterized protein with WD repeat